MNKKNCPLNRKDCKYYNYWCDTPSERCKNFNNNTYEERI